MKFKEAIITLYFAFDTKFKEQFGFNGKEITFRNVVDYLHAPKDASSLAVTRILFGLAMLFDIPDERGGALIYKRWGNANICHFPLFSFIQGVPMPYMTIVYTALWLGALGIMLGYKYHVSARLFTVSYWYLFLIEKSYWNNHTYLFGLVGLLLMFTNANCYWSIDTILEPEIFSETVPYWNYFILKYQFFILYFMAGVKKSTAEWLTGYSVPNLSEHWVFTPFTLFLTIEQTDYIIVHWFIFLFDLTVAFWMMWSRTRHVAMVFCALFHLMNSRLFTIGMFPWVCLATMPLFYPFDWPKLAINYVKSHSHRLKNGIHKMKVNKVDSPTKDNYCNDDDDNVFEKSDVTLDKNNTKKGKANICEMDGDDDNVFEKSDVTLDKNNTKKGKANICEIDDDDDDNVFEKSDVTLNKNNTKQGKANISEIEALENIGCPKSDKEESKSRSHKMTSEKVSSRDEEFNGNNSANYQENTWSKKITTVLIITYMTIQGFLPFSHFITKGYNNWTDGLYGYSWDMMVHTWDIQSVVVKVVDNEKNKHFYIDPHAFSPNDRWFKHGDMVHQYVTCMNNTFTQESGKSQNQYGVLSKNISIFIDVWCSMNGRFVQRMFDPNVDLLQVSWSTFEKIPFLMPLIDEASEWRPVLSKIRNDVHSWGPFSDVIFFADFPGYALDKYIPPELSNVTLTILQGEIAVEPEVTNLQTSQSFQLNTGHHIHLSSGLFHRILNIGKKPAYYMLTFFNKTEANVKNDIIAKPNFELSIGKELRARFSNMVVFGDILLKGFYQVFSSVANVFSLMFLNMGLNVIASVYDYFCIILHFR